MEEKNKIEICLYVVPTPIGNLDDITIRAIKVLTNVDIIACEDTRRTGLLLKSLNIQAKKLTSYHEHNEKEKSKVIVSEILSGKSAALVSDAGTPGISDPAYRLINACIEENVKIIPLPGASALLPALIGSGFGTQGFVFLGFPPHKKGRKTYIENMMAQDYPTIVYESPHRIGRLLRKMTEMGFEKRRICIARELTKIHEEFIRGTVKHCLELVIETGGLKGELVVIISPE